MACSLPCGTFSPDQLWAALSSERCHITADFAPIRWQQICKAANAPAAVLVGGFLGSELDMVLSHSHGGFPAAEASRLDIHVQLLLDTSL